MNPNFSPLKTTHARTNIANANKPVTIVQKISVEERYWKGTGSYATDVIYLLLKYVWILFRF